MKKVLAILLILVITASMLTACAGGLAGTCVTTIDGAEGRMVLRRNGTGEIISHGVSRACTWEHTETTLTVVQDVSGIPYVFLDEVTFVRDGRTLTITGESGNTLIFEKE